LILGALFSKARGKPIPHPKAEPLDPFLFFLALLNRPRLCSTLRTTQHLVPLACMTDKLPEGLVRLVLVRVADHDNLGVAAVVDEQREVRNVWNL
jgi:hypothetical protein